MRALRWRYWPGHLLLVLAIAATTALGLWQFGVSHHHKQQALEKKLSAAPVALVSVLGPNDQLSNGNNGRAVIVNGSLIEGSSVQLGADLFATAVAVQGTHSAIYVLTKSSLTDSGNASSTSDNDQTLHVTFTLSDFSATGWLQPSGTDGANLLTLMGRVHQDLYSAVVVTTDLGKPDVSSGSTWTTGLRNFLYALEWWVFGAFAVWVWWRWLQESMDAPVGSDA